VFNVVKLLCFGGGGETFGKETTLEDLGVDGRKIINRMGGMTGLIATGGALF
jgi:hypothetical protein